MMQDYLCISTRKPVEKLMSGRGADQSRQSELTEDYDVHPGETLDQYGFARRLLDGMRISSCQSSREACLFIFRGMHRLDMLEKGMKMLKKEGRGSPGLDYLEVELKVMRGDFSGAYKDIILQYRQTPPGELDGFRVRQLAAAARKWGRAEKAFDLIRKWTDKYPDGPDSPAVWLDLCLCALDMPDSHLKTAGNALSRCRELLGEQQLVRDLEVKYQARLAAAW